MRDTFCYSIKVYLLKPVNSYKLIHTITKFYGECNDTNRFHNCYIPGFICITLSFSSLSQDNSHSMVVSYSVRRLLGATAVSQSS